MRLFPKRAHWWRPLVLVAVILLAAFSWSPWRWWAAMARYTLAPLLKNRVRDEAGVLSSWDERNFEIFLQQIDDESGVDVRFVLVPGLRGESLEDFSVRTARTMGIGRKSDRRGILFVYDATGHRLRLEVGATLEPIITDAFAGYLAREHVRSFFGAGDPSLGLRTTLFMIQHRLREAVLGLDYDPRVFTFIEDSRRLALGGGASADMRGDTSRAFLNKKGGTSPEARAYFTPQPSPEAAHTRILEWLARGGYETDVPLLTPASQKYMASLPMTRAYNDYMLMMEYGQPYRVDTRGDLALLYFTTNPLISPHFFRRTPAGWVLDVLGELHNTRNYSGFWYTWGLLESGDEFATTFADRYLDMNGVLRVAGGDNRPLPSSADPEITLWPAPVPGDSLVDVTVDEAATRIAGTTGRAVVLLYEAAGLKELAEVAERCHSAGAQVLAFDTDEDSRTLWTLPSQLSYIRAPFTAVHLTPWPDGRLAAAMAPLGISVGVRWTPPIVAVRDGVNGVVAQTEGWDMLTTDSDRLVTACGGG
jgi:uncharacterized protein